MSLFNTQLGRSLLAFVVGCVACGEPDAPPAKLCVPGETRLCNGPGGCEGAQACSLDGQALSACDCGTNPPAGAAAAVDECTGQDPACAVPNLLAAPCQADVDCGGAGLVCWSADAVGLLGFEGGPARGYCTMACTTPDDCFRVDPGAGCNAVDGMEQGMCLRGCFSKDPEPLERKCLDRTDLACWSTAVLGIQPFSISSRQQGFCQPACGSDADCPGRYCDLVSGTCRDEPSQGAPIGAACGVDGDCAGGACLRPIGGASYCSALCAFGALGCGFPEGAANREAACAAPLLSEGGAREGLGDVGSCFELCDQAGDCTLPDWECAVGSGLIGGRSVCQFVGQQ